MQGGGRRTHRHKQLNLFLLFLSLPPLLSPRPETGLRRRNGRRFLFFLPQNVLPKQAPRDGPHEAVRILEIVFFFGPSNWFLPWKLSFNLDSLGGRFLVVAGWWATIRWRWWTMGCKNSSWNSEGLLKVRSLPKIRFRSCFLGSWFAFMFPISALDVVQSNSGGNRESPLLNAWHSLAFTSGLAQDLGYVCRWITRLFSCPGASSWFGEFKYLYFSDVWEERLYF